MSARNQGFAGVAVAVLVLIVSSSADAQMLMGPPQEVDPSAAGHLLERLRAMGTTFDTQEAEAAEPDRAERGVVSARLEEALRDAAPSALLDIEALLVVPNARRHIQEADYVVAMDIVDGRLRKQWINGQEASLYDVEAFAAERTARLRLDEAAHSAAVDVTWRALAKRTPSSFVRWQIETPSVPAEAGSERRRLQVTRDELRALEAIGGPLGLRMDTPGKLKNAVTIAVGAATIGLTAGATYTGDDIGIWQSEPAAPTITLLAPGVTLHDSGQSTNSGLVAHATYMAGIIQGSAPDAHIHFSSPGSCVNFNGVTSWTNPPVYVGSHSFSFDYTNGDTGTYEDCDRDYDNGIMSTGILVMKSAGNKDGSSISDYVAGGSKARNAVTVGNANTTASPSQCGWGTPGSTYPAYKTHCDSLWRDPVGGRAKPEIVAPGTQIEYTNSSYTIVGDGTSASAAFAASLAAVALEAYPLLRGDPAESKALILASAQDFDGTGQTLSARDGYGQPDFHAIEDLDASILSAGGSNSVDWFSADNFYLVSGRSYRIVLAWMNDGDHAYNNGGEQSSRWQLVVDPPGSGHPTITVNDPRTGQQVIDYTAPVSGDYTLTGVRVANNDASVPSEAAIAVVEHP